jgi:choline dehydrogenase
VRYSCAGKIEVARASREVILSAGAINSPQILLLSGIGPADELRAHGINVTHALRGVGKNLQDHLVSGVVHEDRSRITNNVHPLMLLSWLARYQISRKGPLASNVAETGGFVRSRLATTDPRPDLQIHFLPVGSDQESFDEQAFLAKGHAF